MVATMAGLQEARRVAGAAAPRLMAAMTAAFGTGQLIGPLTVGARRRRQRLLRPSSRRRAAAAAAAVLLMRGRAALRIPLEPGDHHDARLHRPLAALAARPA